jgi:hypothetical protein
MIHRLLYPATVQGRGLHFALVAYLSISIIGCTAPQKPSVKPPATIARAMETRSFAKDMTTVLKAAINALQDMDYTIDVLNSDIGLITASRTSQQQKSELSIEENDAERFSEFEKACLTVFGLLSLLIFMDMIFGGDDDSGNNSNDSSPIQIGGGGGKDDPTGPRIYRYKVTINLNDLDADNTKIRVSATGEIEQDGKILSTGGIHELEFFQQFFANVNKALFLEDQGQ